MLVAEKSARRIGRVLLAIDGSDGSDKALRFLQRKLAPDGVELLVTHVMPFTRYGELKEAGAAMLSRYKERLVQAGYRAKELITLGHPAEEFLKTIELEDIDLIITGPQGLGALGRFFAGRVSSRLVEYSSCSVLVVH
ncbi:universal stress protein [Nitrospira sp. Nam80]